MPRKKKSAEVVVESAPTVRETGEHPTGAEADDHEADSEPSELNRLISEEEYSNDKAEVVVMNHRTPDTSSPTSSGSRHNSRGSGSGPKTVVDEDVDKISSEENPDPVAPPPEDEDCVDECARLTRPDPDYLGGGGGGGDGVTSDQPHSGEYTKIMEMLKEAEADADPEHEAAKRRMEFLMKYNPRHPDSDLGFMDYCCVFFQCFALCIEG